MSRIIVLKLGGSVLGSEADLSLAVHEVYDWVRRGWKVVAVVSAIRGQTDALLRRAASVSEAGGDHARALLAGTGELVSASLLGLALDRAGIAARVATPWSIGLRAHGPAMDAEPVRVDAARVRRALTMCDVVVTPGFVGVGAAGELVLLGRGGSDLSAIFLASTLGAARCRLVKDVDGLYECDPAAPARAPRRFLRLDWDRAATLGGDRGGCIQAKAARFAKRAGVSFEVGRALTRDGTRVGAIEPLIATQPPARHAQTVALLGCGTVGFGVYTHLQRLTDRFSVVSVTVRDTAKAAAAGVDPGLIRTDPIAAASDSRASIVVEALGGLDPAADAIEAALARGATVVTANKSVVAAHVDSPAWQAAIAEGRLLCSACVGGAAPVLEAVSRIAARRGIARVDGVLNGTTNYVLTRLDAGAPLEDALRDAQRSGFAEIDPSHDLDGRDAAAKLSLVARAAWGVTLRPREVVRTPVTPGVVASLRETGQATEVVRQIASVSIDTDGRVRARVGPVLAPRSSPLARAIDEWNVAVVTDPTRRQHVIRGRGAGRWPTAESVVADLIQAADRLGSRLRETSLAEAIAGGHESMGAAGLRKARAAPRSERACR